MSAEQRPDEHAWLDQDAGPLVRSYALTGGRAAPGANRFGLMTYVVAKDYDSSQVRTPLQPEHHSILRRAHTPASVAEIASHLSRPLGVVRVLLNDLHEIGAIAVVSTRSAGTLPDDQVLQAVIDGLRAG